MTVVETTLGKLRGQDNGGVHVFRGIRYGADTGGENRFRPPVAPAPQPGITEAVRPGASAPQLPRPHNTDPFFSWYSQIEPVSEDCLFLNVFTPASDAARRPVLFWIHGGGWREYAGSAPGFDGSRLAQSQDVVVVTINHRLNVFGFLALETDDPRFADSANVGILDIVAALEWVRDNIAAFGGDPDNVTLFGESGGASKIAALMATRHAKRLFHKAIIESSGGGLKLATREEALGFAGALAGSLGVDRPDPAALQALPMDRILSAITPLGISYRASLDGRTFTHHPFDGAPPPEAAGLPVMTGCTRTEATYYMRDDPANFDLPRDEVIRRLRSLLETDPETATQIHKRYRSVYPDESHSMLMFLAASDFIFKKTTWGMAEMQSRQAPAWAFHFEWNTPVEGGRMGAVHTLEVPFVFGTTAAARPCIGDGPEVEPLAERMMATWAAFARQGDPNNASLPAWPQYSATDRATMILDTECRVESDPGSAARAALDLVAPFGYQHNLSAISQP
ncbi:carboxylesterase/lipase family protein [Antarctobacter sp.]|uniref:carboxylesterase/lipase family protein n=1 Tax=Antarctobacter sp. TaxID=1872577 RepID=UPI003A8E6F6D